MAIATAIDKTLVIVLFIWEHGTALIAAFAAWATWRAAQQAARSADIARNSMRSSTDLASATLNETRGFNRRSNFENRYTLLLEQHNIYHQQLCDYIDRIPELNKSNEMFSLFDNSLMPGQLDNTLQTLTGHQIVSRYMRVLYHLLKFIDGGFYLDDDFEGMKNYTSPLRSTIRNDILYLIAVNALNVITETSKESGYPNYQRLLHRFDFFEHAVFLFPLQPNRLILEQDKVALILSNIGVSSTKYIDLLKENIHRGIIESPGLCVNSPAMLCLATYDNLLRGYIIPAFDKLEERLLRTLKDELNGILNTYLESSGIIKKTQGWEYRVDTRSEWKRCAKKIIRKIGHDVYRYKINPYEIREHYKYFEFRDPFNIGLSNSVINGKTVAVKFEEVFRCCVFYREVSLLGGLEQMENKLRMQFRQRVNSAVLEMYAYNVLKQG